MNRDHINAIVNTAQELGIDLDDWTLADDRRVPWRPDISPPSQGGDEHREVVYENFAGVYTMIVTVQNHDGWIVTSFSIRNHEGYN
jgi:hypothetical protein